MYMWGTTWKSFVCRTKLRSWVMSLSPEACRCLRVGTIDIPKIVMLSYWGSQVIVLMVSVKKMKEAGESICNPCFRRGEVNRVSEEWSKWLRQDYWSGTTYRSPSFETGFQTLKNFGGTLVKRDFSCYPAVWFLVLKGRTKPSTLSINNTRVCAV